MAENEFSRGFYVLRPDTNGIKKHLFKMNKCDFLLLNWFCLLLAAFRFALYLRYGACIIFRNMQLPVALGAVRLFGIGSAHTGLRHK